MSVSTPVMGHNPAALDPAGRREAAKVCLYEDWGLLSYGEAWERQRALVEERKAGRIADWLAFVEHPHVVSLGRSARPENLLFSEEEYRRRGIDFWRSNRGGDVTYHGPGQIVGYPIIDLREWKRDVLAYLRALEQVMIDAVAEFGVTAGRLPGCTGVWAGEAKLAAIGVHVSRWVASHGFALNLSPDLRYFGYIVPCGLRKPVTSMAGLLDRPPSRQELIAALVRRFGCVFGRRMRAAGVS